MRRLTKCKYRGKKCDKALLALAGAGLSLAMTGPVAIAADNVSNLNNPAGGAPLLVEHPSTTVQNDGTNNTHGSGATQAVGAAQENIAFGTNASISVYPGTSDASFDTAIGHGATISGSAGTAIGAAAQVNSLFGGTAVGTAATAKDGQMGTAIGHMSTATGNFASALGANATANGAKSEAIGANSTAEGASATAVGTAAKATADDSVALGQGATASHNNTTASGSNAKATAYQATAYGANAQATVDQTLAVGAEAKATSMAATAVGISAEANQKNASAFGMNTKATAENATALGTGSTASGKDTTSIGVSSVAGNEYATAIGDNARVTGSSATGIGADVLVSGNDAVAIGVMAEAKAAEEAVFGFMAKADKDGATAIGAYAEGKGENSVAIGGQAKATNENAMALGYAANASGVDSLAMGANSSVTAESAVAIGQGSTATEEYTVSFGSADNTRRLVNVSDGNVVKGSKDAVNGGQLYEKTRMIAVNPKLHNDDAIATGEDSMAFGLDASATGNRTVAIGAKSEASGLYGTATGVYSISSNEASTAYGYGSIAEGKVSTATGAWSRAVNTNTTATGYYAYASKDGSTATGSQSKATGDYSTATGYVSVASGKYSTASGYESDATGSSGTAVGSWSNASGASSTAIGGNSKATGDASTAIGYASEATGYISTAMGNGSKANGQASVATGYYSKVTENYGTATGTNTTITGVNGTANGYHSKVSAENGTAIGYYSNVNGKNSVAIGASTTVNEENVVGIGNRKLTQVNAGVADTDAVNVSQLKEGLAGKANIDLDNITVAGQKVITDLADSVDNTAAVENTDGNLTVSATKDGNTTTYEVNLASDVKANSFSVGGVTYISAAGLNANGQKVTNVADGAVPYGSKDAINGGQLYKATSDINNAINEAVTNIDTKLDGKANISLDNINAAGTKVITDLADSVDDTAAVTAKDGNLSVTSSKEGNVTTYEVALGDDLSVNSVTTTGGITVGDKAVFEKTVNVKGTFEANSNAYFHKNLGVDKDLSVLGDAEISGDVKAGSVSIGSKTYVNSDGINANSQKVTNVADGSVAEGSTDAVNGGQLYTVQSNITNDFNTKLDGKANVSLDNINEAGTKVITDLADIVDDTAAVTTKDSNLSVTSSKEGNVTTYEVSLSRSIEADSFSVGDKTYISATGLNANSQKVTNVADGAVAEGSKDAINGGQLYKATSDINNTIEETVSNIDTKLDGKANISLDNINNAGEKVITDLADSVDDTAEVKNTDSNLTVSATKDGNTTTYEVNLASNVKADSFSVGDKTYISATGLNANSQKVTNVADGSVAEGSTDAVNGGQLYAVQNSITSDFDTKLNGKANVSLDNINDAGTKVITDLADSVDDTAEVKNTDGNLTVSATKDGNTTTYEVNLASDVKADSFSVGDKTYISAAGFNANGQKVTNVADGSVAEGSKDAVNGGQLYKATSDINNTISEAVSNIDTKLDGKANISLDNINEAGSKVITDLADSVDDTAAVKNTDGNLTVSATKEGNTTTYEVNLASDVKADSFSVGDKTYISVAGLNATGQKVTNVADGSVVEDSTDAVNGGQLHKVDADIRSHIDDVENTINDTFNTKLDDKANISLNNINSDGEKVITDLAKSVEETSDVSNTDGNLTVTATKVGNNTTYDVNLARNLEADSYRVGEKVYISVDGLNANSQKISNVANGEVSKNSKDAVNGSQLYEVQQLITGNVDVVVDGKANTSLDNINDAGTKVITDLAKSVEETSEVTNTDGNLTVTAKKEGNNTVYDVNLARDIVANSFAVGDKVYITAAGLNANSQKVVNVADGTVADGSKDAVNGGQLHKIDIDLRSTINEAVTNIDTKLDGKANVNLDNINDAGKKTITDIADSVDDTAEVKNTDGNLTVSATKDGNVTAYSVNLAKNINADTYAAGGKVYISSSGLNANGQKVVGVADGEVSKTSKDAVNGSQLYVVQTNITSEVNTKLDNKANIDLDNISIDGKKVITDLAKTVDTTAEVKAGDGNVVVTAAKNGNTTEYAVKLADDIRAASFGIGGNVYISADGFNANSKRVINVAKAVADTDAVNLGQLNEAIAAVNSDKNPLAVEYNSDKKDVVSLKGENGTTITNVKAGVVSKDSTDAVNGSQLYATNQQVEKNSTDIASIRITANQNSTNISQNRSDIDALKEADKLVVKYTSSVKDEIVLGGNGGTTIKNVAAAQADDEAVNLKQLNDAVKDIVAGNDKNAVHYSDDTHKTAVLDGEGDTSLTGVAAGEIAKNSKDAVNGGQLYDEQEARKAADKELDNRIGSLDAGGSYSYIKYGNNLSQNLAALDDAVADAGLVKDNGREITVAKDSATKVVNIAGKGGEARVLTGVQTDAGDASSAANVDYVNRSVGTVQEYSDNIAAQAAAMSSLHPLDWEKNDKVSVSASLGAYKDKTAGAVGAFYRPDRKSMVSFQAAIGHDNNMFGIGFSKKLSEDNPDDEPISNEEAVALREEVSELRTKNSELEEKYERLEAQTKQILDVLSKQNGLNAETVSSLLVVSESK